MSHLSKYHCGEMDIETCINLLQDEYVKAATNKHIAFTTYKEDKEISAYGLPLFTERYLHKISNQLNTAKNELSEGMLHYYMEFPDEFEHVLERIFCKADLSNVMTLEAHYNEEMEDPYRQYNYSIDDYIGYVDDNLTDADRNPKPKEKLKHMVVR